MTYSKITFTYTDGRRQILHDIQANQNDVIREAVREAIKNGNIVTFDVRGGSIDINCKHVSSVIYE